MKSVPLPVTANPRDVFERLFGDGDALDPASRQAQLRRRSSILDFVADDTARLSDQLGAGDRHKLDEFLDATRDIERRIQKAMASGDGPQATTLERPAGIPDSFDDHVRLMIDLQVLAMQADVTRVGSFMIGRELSNRTYPEIGVPDSHHMLSHHGNSPLLDRTLVIRGSAFGDPNVHDHMDLPVVVAGGLVPGDRHVVVPKGTTMSNLLLAALHVLDVPAKAFGDSTGPLAALAHG